MIFLSFPPNIISKTASIDRFIKNFSLEIYYITSSADPAGDRGSRPPLENHKLYGFL